MNFPLDVATELFLKVQQRLPLVEALSQQSWKELPWVAEGVLTHARSLSVWLRHF